jgi:hypothetical protein
MIHGYHPNSAHLRPLFISQSDADELTASLSAIQCVENKSGAYTNYDETLTESIRRLSREWCSITESEEKYFVQNYGRGNSGPCNLARAPADENSRGRYFLSLQTDQYYIKLEFTVSPRDLDGGDEEDSRRTLLLTGHSLLNQS